jgi:O-acetyl-ADP-ribose deacetylase (regulator of RNase III)
VAAETNESIDIQISTLPWDQVPVDAFVCPTNSEGIMSQFPASKLRDLAGKEVEDLVKEHTPLAIGAAFVTPAGKMKARYLIHVLVACRVKGFSSIAVPLMGAFDSGIPAEEAARAIHSELKAYRGDRPLKAYLMAKDADDVEVFELAMEGNIP